MKKIFICSFLLCCCLRLYAAEEKPIITVLDFETSDVSASEMKSIISILSSSLFQTDLFTVIDVSQRETVLKEMDFSMSGCTDESCMLEVGKLLSAEGIVVGSLSKVGSKYVLSTKLLETETARTLSTADGIYTDLDELLEKIPIISEKLSKPFITTVVEESPEEMEIKPGATNIPAWATLAGSVGCLGTGAYFLIVSLPLLIDFNNAFSAYDDTTTTDEDEVTALYITAEAARLAAADGNAKSNFIIGASLTGAGVALGVVSTILFIKNRDPDGPEVAAAILPGPATLAFNIRY